MPVNAVLDVARPVSMFGLPVVPKAWQPPHYRPRLLPPRGVLAVDVVVAVVLMVLARQKIATCLVVVVQQMMMIPWL